MGLVLKKTKTSWIIKRIWISYLIEIKRKRIKRKIIGRLKTKIIGRLKIKIIGRLKTKIIGRLKISFVVIIIIKLN